MLITVQRVDCKKKINWQLIPVVVWVAVSSLLSAIGVPGQEEPKGAGQAYHEDGPIEKQHEAWAAQHHRDKMQHT